MTSPRIVLYATPACPHCKAAREVLTEWGEPFLEVDPRNDPVAFRDLLASAGAASVPAVVVGERVLVGFDRERLDEMLREPPLEPEPVGESPLDELLAEEDDEPGVG